MDASLSENSNPHRATEITRKLLNCVRPLCTSDFRWESWALVYTLGEHVGNESGDRDWPVPALELGSVQSRWSYSSPTLPASVQIRSPVIVLGPDFEFASQKHENRLMNYSKKV